MCKYNKGFTLVELMVTLAILAIIMGIAAPNLSTMIQNGRLSSATSDFNTALQLAKAESISRITAITICKDDGTSAACAGGGDWSQGWIIFVDVDGDTVVDGGDTILNVHESIGGADFSFTGSTNEVDSTITFSPSGTTSITSIAALIACDRRGFTSSKGLIVTITGRGSSMKGAATGETTC
jgi:type IV fimbrial biogenesis protein FimT